MPFRATVSLSRTIAMGVALLIVGVIVLDLCDRSCYALELTPPEDSVMTTSAVAADSCAGSCVPDCFCCSNPSPAVTVSLSQHLTVLADTPAPPERHVAPGFSTVPDHVPLPVRPPSIP